MVFWYLNALFDPDQFSPEKGSRQSLKVRHEQR
jgi:hypothetical protein